VLVQIKADRPYVDEPNFLKNSIDNPMLIEANDLEQKSQDQSGKPKLKGRSQSYTKAMRSWQSARRQTIEQFQWQQNYESIIGTQQQRQNKS
jgi:hypothetical protein